MSDVEAERAQRSRDAIALFLLAALISCAVLPDLFAGEPLTAFGDNSQSYYPLRFEAARQWLEEGRVPLWNPYKRAGAPLAGDAISAAFYPPTLLLGLGSSSNSVALDWLAYLHHLVAAFATFFLLRTMRAQTEAAAFGATLYALSGYMVMSAGLWIGIQNTIAWTPLVCASVLRASRTGGFGRWCALGAGFYAAHIYSGFPEYAAYTGALALGLAVALSVAGGQGRLRPLWAVAIIGLGGIALAGPQVLLTLEAAANGARAAVLPVDWTGLGSMEPSAYFGFLAPLTPEGVPVLGLLYVSPVALALAGVAAGARGVSQRWALVVFGAAMLLTLGSSLPFGPIASFIPGLSSFRGAFKHIAELVLAVAVLAGLGADRWLKSPADIRSRVGLSLLGATVLLVYVLWREPEAKLGWPNLAALGTLAACATCAWREAPRAGVLIATVGLALSLLGSRALWLDGQREARGPHTFSNDSSWTQEAGPARVLVLHYPFEQIHEQSLFGDLPVLQRVPALNGAGPLLWAPLQERLGLSEPGHLPLDELFARSNPLLDALGIRYVLFPGDPAGNVPREALAQKVGGVARRDAAGLWVKRPSAAEFVRVAESVVCEQPPAERLPESGADLTETVWIECGGTEGGLRAGAGPGIATLRTLEAGRVAVTTEIQEAKGGGNGLLVVSQSDYPGWIATVDGQAAPIVRVSDLVQGVWVPPGRHDVELSYEPQGFRWGVGLILIGAVALAALWRWAARPAVTP